MRLGCVVRSADPRMPSSMAALIASENAFHMLLVFPDARAAVVGPIACKILGGACFCVSGLCLRGKIRAGGGALCKKPNAA